MSIPYVNPNGWTIEKAIFIALSNFQFVGVLYLREPHGYRKGKILLDILFKFSHMGTAIYSNSGTGTKNREVQKSCLFDFYILVIYSQSFCLQPFFPNPSCGCDIHLRATGIILRTHGVPTTTTTVDAGWQGRWMVSGVDTETNVQQYYTKIYPLLIFPK